MVAIILNRLRMPIRKIILNKLIVLLGIIAIIDLKAQVYSNPISDLADPHITYYDDNYYLTGTTGSNISIRKAPTLNALKFASPIVAFMPPSGGPCCNFWAPELHRINDTWYIYYTAGNSPDLSSQRTWVIENTSADPAEGTWTSRGQIYHPVENFWAIDGSVFKLENKHYFTWSGHTDNLSDVQHIFISEMSSPWTLTGPRVLISSPEYLWERNGEVNEAPVALQRNNRLFLFYSASGCWTDDYAVGMLSMDASDDPLIASSWTKSESAVFVTNVAAFAYGPGHNAFFLSPDETEVWNTYHATTVEAGACDNTRTTRAQVVRWNGDGTPDLGSPVVAGRPLAGPSGEIEQPESLMFENGIYKLVSKASEKVLNTAGCSPALGTDIVQSAWNGMNCQLWNIQSTEDGYFVLTAVRGGLALDVAGCSNDDYGNVHTWAPNGAPCQQWKIEETGSGFYRLIARHSNKALTVSMDSEAEGADVVQLAWSGTDGQQWRIEVADEIVTSAEKNDDPRFSIFPNPAKNSFTVSKISSDVVIGEVTLVDVFSRVVYHESIAVDASSFVLDARDIAAGVYFLRITEDQNDFVIKVVIEK
jgi:GH43 family beta-xylosidase